MPPGKLSALRNAKPVAPEDVTNPPGTLSRRDPFADSGAPAEITAVKSDLVADMVADRAAMASTAPRAVPSLRSALEPVWASSAIDATLRETKAAVDEAAADPTYRGYVDNDFVVDGWRGVRINGTVAFALLKAHDTYRLTDSGRWDPDDPGQWHVHLVKEGGRWQLVKQDSVSSGA
jgi:hypothetical protein